MNFLNKTLLSLTLVVFTLGCGQNGGLAPSLSEVQSPPNGSLPDTSIKKNCADILAANPDSSSGVYSISYDGSGSVESTLSVYCDMSTEGGGWTLVMKQKSHDGVTLQGDTAYFTSSTAGVLNDNNSNLGPNDENLVSAAFTKVTGLHLMLVAANESTVQTQTLAAASTAFGAFATAASYSDDINSQRPNWFVSTTTYPNGMAISSARFGFNIRETPNLNSSNYYCAVRWGWVANENPSTVDIGTHDACGGLGAYGTQYGSSYMSGSKSTWQPVTVLLYIK
jgi:hypothetical protein